MDRPQSEAWIDVVQLYLINTGAFSLAVLAHREGSLADPKALRPGMYLHMGSPGWRALF